MHTLENQSRDQRANQWLAWIVVGLAVGLQSCSHVVKDADAKDPPARVARLAALDGTVSFQPPGATTWSQATPNYTITTGDRLYTDADGRAELDFGSSALRLDGTSDVAVTNLNNDVTQLGLSRGTAIARVYQWSPNTTYEIDTPNGALLPLAPGSYRIVADPSGYTDVAVDDGRMQLTGPGLDRILSAGDAVRLSGSNPIQILAAAVPVIASALMNWSNTRDQRYVTTSPSQQYVSSTIPGWEDLNGYGTWSTVPQYGEVWTPTNVANDWTPYRDGHWAYVQPWGWTWVDDQPWGYAPTHYGRWANLSNGWAWVPGPVVQQPVYSPAEVLFADVANAITGAQPETVQAWFPLAPGEPYVPWYPTSTEYVRRINITNLRNVRDIDRLIRVRDVNAIHWANQRKALTVVPATVLIAGAPVATSIIRVRPEQITRVRVQSHPLVHPAARLVMGGRPAVRPPATPRGIMVVRNAARVIPAPHSEHNNAKIATPMRNAPPAARAPARPVHATPTRAAPQHERAAPSHVAPQHERTAPSHAAPQHGHAAPASGHGKQDGGGQKGKPPHK